MSLRLGILGSTRGTNLNAIHHAIQQKKLNAQIEIVFSNKETAPILDRARELGLRTQSMVANGLAREEYDKKVNTLLQQYHIDLLVLIGYMRILSAEFIQHWKNRIINVHPSLLPAFAGKMDLDVHQAVLEAGVLETGCTVHYVTAEVDAGPVLLQTKCNVEKQDTAETLKQRVQAIEGAALVEAIQRISMQHR